jgi:hypothetical protein
LTIGGSTHRLRTSINSAFSTSAANPRQLLVDQDLGVNFWTLLLTRFDDARTLSDCKAGAPDWSIVTVLVWFGCAVGCEDVNDADQIADVCVAQRIIKRSCRTSRVYRQ